MTVNQVAPFGIACTKNGRRWDWAILVGLLLAYAYLFYVYYPPLAGIEDEVGFINQGIVFSKGSVSAEGAGYQGLDDFVLAKGRHVSRRNPGRSLLVAASLPWGGYRSAFVSGAIIHIALVIVAGLIMVSLGYSPLWGALVLFHPTLAIYSRTVMGDTGSGLFLLLALYSTVRMKRPGICAGVCIGAAALMRYQSGLVLPFMSLAMAFTLPIDRPKREALACLAGGSGVACGIVAYNQCVFGHALGWTGYGYFSIEFVASHLFFYVFALLTFWPFMLLTILFDRSRLRFVVLALTLPIVLFLVPYYFLDKSPSWLQSLVLGQRLIQPALPVWIACYAWTLAELFSRRLSTWASLTVQRLIGMVICVGLLGMTGLIFREHQRHLDELVAAREAVVNRVPDHAVLLCNTTLAKLFGIPQPGPTYRIISFNATQEMLQPENELHLEGTRFYLAMLSKNSPAEFGDSVEKLVMHYHLEPVATPDLKLKLYVSKADSP
jgi:hypothetical protein